MTPITKGMRIGIDVSPLQTGHQYRGVGTYVRNLVINLASIDSVNQYHLFCLDEIQDEFRNLGANFTVELMRVPQTGRLASVLSHQILLPIRVRELHLNIFHTPFVPTFMASPGLPVFLGWSRVTTIHERILAPGRTSFPSYRRIRDWTPGFDKGLCLLVIDFYLGNLDIPSASKELSAAIGHYGNDPRILYRLAELQLRLGNPLVAEEYLERALDTVRDSTQSNLSAQELADFCEPFAEARRAANHIEKTRPECNE